jgi:hypothetical protein
LQCTVTERGNCKRLREFEEIGISRQSCRGDCEKQGGNSEDFCLDFAQEFGLWMGGREGRWVENDLGCRSVKQIFRIDNLLVLLLEARACLGIKDLHALGSHACLNRSYMARPCTTAGILENLKEYE